MYTFGFYSFQVTLMLEMNVSEENYANCGWIYVPVARSTLKTRREPSLLLQLLAQKSGPGFSAPQNPLTHTTQLWRDLRVSSSSTYLFRTPKAGTTFLGEEL